MHPRIYKVTEYYENWHDGWGGDFVELIPVRSEYHLTEADATEAAKELSDGEGEVKVEPVALTLTKTDDGFNPWADFIASFLIHEGTTYTKEGSWCWGLEELKPWSIGTEEDLETIRAALLNRVEVLGVDIVHYPAETYLDVMFSTTYCKNCMEEKGEEDE